MFVWSRTTILSIEASTGSNAPTAARTRTGGRSRLSKPHCGRLTYGRCISPDRLRDGRRRARPLDGTAGPPGRRVSVGWPVGCKGSPQMTDLRPFQRKFIRAATAPGVDTAALSLPRGNGKSALAGHLVSRILSPDDKLFRRGTESVLCAASIEQARIVFRFARETLSRRGYRFPRLAHSDRHRSQGDEYPSPGDREQRENGDGIGRVPMGDLR